MTDDKIHWFSIVNSLVILVFLSGIVGLIMTRILRKVCCSATNTCTHINKRKQFIIGHVNRRWACATRPWIGAWSNGLRFVSSIILSAKNSRMCHVSPSTHTVANISVDTTVVKGCM